MTNTKNRDAKESNEELAEDVANRPTAAGRDRAAEQLQGRTNNQDPKIGKKVREWRQSEAGGR